MSTRGPGLSGAVGPVAPASPAQLRMLAVNYASLGVIAKLEGDNFTTVAIGAKSLMALADQLEGAAHG